ncbi:hypothetical protein BZG36_03180 [Bifiguratus adelaidae]|uniref:STAS domain-containing protein n=1 Tax=Bifiguratus adelaidae TaxID=1938954 RepID=A0A261XYJ1_9FUNG|nr:hypothetical protein BZG36_03180 [Bifiguratus adelaidae]
MNKPESCSDTDVISAETTPLIPTRSPKYIRRQPLPGREGTRTANRRQTFNTRLKYYIPITQWLPSYNLRQFGGDLVAGCTLACILIPAGLSYATALCKLPAIHGLYAVTFPAIIYAILGMSRQMSIGPEASLSMLVGSAIAQQRKLMPEDENPEQTALLMAFFMTLWVGIFCFSMGLFRLGFLDSLMSRALLRGFVTAVGIVVNVQQLITLLGLVSLAEENGVNEHSNTVERLAFLFNNMQHAHMLTTTVSFTAVTILLISRGVKARLSKRFPWVSMIPEVLVLVIVVTFMTYLLQWDKKGLAILGTVDAATLPTPSIPHIPHVKHVKDLVFTSALMAIIGFVESVIVAKTYATKHNYPLSQNRELIALGTANIVSGLFQGLPAFGSLARSKINDRVGARTQMAGFITAIITMLAILFLSPYFYYMPKPILSAIIFVAVLSLLSETPEDVRFMFKVGAWRDFALLILTFVATVFGSLEFGTLLAVAMSLLLTVKESSNPRITILGHVKGTSGDFEPISNDPDSIHLLEDILIVRLEEPLYFANTSQLKDRLQRLEAFGDMTVHPSETPYFEPPSNIVFDAGPMASIDASAMKIMFDIVEAYQARHAQVFFVNLNATAKGLFDRAGLTDIVGHTHFYRRISEAVDTIERQ